MWATLKRIGGAAKTILLSAGVVAAGLFGIWLANLNAHSHGGESTLHVEEAKSDKIVRTTPSRFVVPESVAKFMNLKTAPIGGSSAPVRLPAFQGRLALDQNAQNRVKARFGGEIVSIATVATPTPPGVISTHPNSPPPAIREIRVGDTVKAGQLLAVIWSRELGEKKSDLIEAISKLKADAKYAVTLRETYKSGGGISEKSVLDAERVVDSDQIAIDKIEKALVSMRVPESEIASVRAEADKLGDPKAKRLDPAEWARVEIRAALSGTILEKNNVAVGDLVDTSTELFKIGDLSHLTVWAHVYEDDLQLLLDLPKPIQWMVSLKSRPDVVYNGTLEQIGSVIDPNQNTALVSGRVENRNGELIIGQLISVTVERPASSGEFAVPAEAVVEDGRESFVFQRNAAKPTEYERHAVKVLRRTRDLIYLAKEPACRLRSGDELVTCGSLLLREAVDLLPAPAETVTAGK